MGITAVPKETKKQWLWKKGGRKCIVVYVKSVYWISDLFITWSKFSDLAIHKLFLFPFEAFSHLRDAAEFGIHLARCKCKLHHWRVNLYDSSILDYQSRLGTHCQSTFERQCIENPVPIHFIVTTLSVLPSTLGPLVTWSVYPLFRSWKLRFVRMPSPPIKPMDHPH